jgi:hypothetical protein
MRRLDLLISADLDRELTAIAESAGIAQHEVLRRGLAVLKAARIAKARGLPHIGFTTDPARLDLELTGVL